jgi:hypothetical protein
MARLHDVQQQAINNYLRFGAVSCKRSGTREQLAYHSDAKHALSLDGRQQLLSHILEMETPELLNSSSAGGHQKGCQLSWSNDFELLPLSSGHRNNLYSSRTAGEQQQQQVVVARGFARGEILGFVLGCMMPSSDAEQLLLSAASSEEAMQMAQLSFGFELECEEEQRQQQLQGGSSSRSKGVTVVAAGFLTGNPLAQVWCNSHCSLCCVLFLLYVAMLCTASVAHAARSARVDRLQGALRTHFCVGCSQTICKQYPLMSVLLRATELCRCCITARLAPALRG